MPSVGSPSEHRYDETSERMVLLVHSALHVSQRRWQFSTRDVRLARHISMSKPASGVSRSRANLNSQYRRSGRIMYSTSVTPERCVREAFGEQYAGVPSSVMQ